MVGDDHKAALLRKVTEMLGLYYLGQKQMQTMMQWKKLWIHPN